MYKSHQICVVVPCYNEETQIGRVIDTMPDYVDHIVIVDDCSPDKTSEVVRSYQEKHPKVVLLVHEVNQGVGGAIATGYKWARDNAMDAAVVMAGDGQMDPADLPALLEPVLSDGADYSKGNRLVHASASRTIPKIRFFGNAVLSLLTKIASGYWHIADSQTGYTVIGKDALHTIDWDLMYKRYGQPNDLLVRLNVHQFKVRDVPIRPVYNVGEVSGIKIRRVVWTISSLLLRLFVWRLRERYIVRDFHPLVFFYALGVVLLFVTVFLFTRLVILWFMLGSAPVLTAVALMMSGSLGLQSVFFAMWFDMDANRHLR